MSYLPDHFISRDWTVVESFLQTFPLATLISYFEDDIFTSHIPFISQNKKLIGHLNKENPQYQHLNKARIELVFHAGDAYLSPTEFETDELPTFNYAKVHVKGKASYIDDSKLIQSLVDMTSQLDDGFQLVPTSPKIDTLKHFIQGFEISIENYHARFKMSQDKSKTHFDKAKAVMLKNQKNKLNYFLNTLKHQGD